jgi:hypothetical protein
VAAGGPGAAGLVPQLLDRVLHDPSFGVAAVAVAREVASHQPVASAVPRLEQLASPTMGR